MTINEIAIITFACSTVVTTVFYWREVSKAVKQAEALSKRIDEIQFQIEFLEQDISDLEQNISDTKYNVPTKPR